MKLRHRLAHLVVFLSATIILLPPHTHGQHAVFKLDDVLTPDPNITIGKFDNGLTYYIRTNAKPEKRAELRLVVRAGSVLEDDDQQGLAHFVEHMAFNGTASFPKQELVNFLERSGVRFGPHLNAYTSFDETVYMIQVPTDSPAVMRKAFKILEEWAHAITLDETEIDKERGVVGEEWRLGRGASERISNKHNPFLFYKSRYAERLPIGKKEVIDTCSYETLRRFYRDWYRPDLMAVIAVGDFDKAEVEVLITEHFGALRNLQPERERKQFTLADHTETLVSIATDTELPFASVNAYFKRDAKEEKTVADYRKNIVKNIHDGMLNARLRERLQQPNPPFVTASTGDFRFVGNTQAYGLFAGVKEDSIVLGLKAILDEAFRVKQHGFTQSELERRKKETLRFIEQAFRERDKTESRSYAQELIRHVLRKEPIPGMETEYTFYQQFVPEITLSEVNQLSSVRLTEGNRVITVSAPKKEGLVVPTEAEILSLISAAATATSSAYVDQVSSAPLIASVPTPGTITGIRTLESLGTIEWKLSNGALVVLKPTDFKNDEILFSAYSIGGTSLASDTDFLSVSNAAGLVNRSGVGAFDAIVLQKMLAGKVVSVSPTISELSEGFSGNTSPADLETMFQLIHLYFTKPRNDSSAASAYLTRLRAFLQNRSVSPEAVFQDTVQMTMAQYHHRARPLTPSLLDEIDIDRAFSFYKNRFSDASDFIFFFVGNFAADTIKPLIERYLASLPSLDRIESWRDIGMKPPHGVIKKEVRKGIEPKSFIQLHFTGPFDWSMQSRFDFQAMIEVLRIKLREVLREDKGGVYGVGVFGSPSLFPRKEYRITIGFGCSPERVDEMINAVTYQIDTLKMRPAEDMYITKVKELQRRDREVNLKENQFWLVALRMYYANGEDPEGILKYGTLIERLTAGAVQNVAKKYLNVDNYVKVVLKPEKQ